MKKTYSYIAAVLLLFSMAENGSADLWRMFTNGNDIREMAMHNHWLWCATTGGVVRWDTRDMTYQKFTTLDGLPTNGINCIDVGPNGTVWCGTDYGAVRYDGVKWDTFKVEDGLYNDNVNDVAVGSDGVVWCSTEDGGISNFDGETWTVMTWPDVLPVRWIWEIAVAPGGDLWFGSQDVYRYDGESFELMSGSLGEDEMRTMGFGRNGDVWLSMSADLHYYDGSVWKVMEIETFRPSVIDVGLDNTALFAASGDIFKFDGKFTYYYDVPGHTKVTALTVGDDGTVWAGLSGGAYGYRRGMLLRLHNGEWETYSTEDSVIGNYIMCGSVENEDSVVLGTSDGISRYSNSSFAIPEPDTIEWSIFEDTRPYAIAVDAEGVIWFGTSWGLMSYGGDSVSYYSPDNGLPGQYVYAVETVKSELWVAARQYGMAYPSGKGVTRLHDGTMITYTTDDGLAGNWIQAITHDSDGNIWIGAKTSYEGVWYKAASGYSQDTTGGVSRFDGSSWISWYPEDGIAHYEVLSLAAGPDGVIWAGTREGASKFDGEVWESFYIEDGLPDNRINTVAVDSDDVVWFGTNNGATSFDGVNWTAYTTADGLPDRVVTTILVDHDNNVYFCTDHGFSVLERSPVHVDSQVIRPVDIRIAGNAPNPFNPSTTIRFTLPGDQHVDLSVYNSVGQRIRTLASERIAAGEHRVAWDGRDESGRAVSSGIYIAGLRAGGSLATHRMTLVR